MRIVAGEFKNRTIKVPKGLNVRPTTSRLREAVFNICQTYIEDCRFLDLYAGSGAMGFEALSRGAGHVTFVDNSKESYQCILDNIKTLDVKTRARALYGDVLKLSQEFNRLGERFDIIYIDPPYHLENGNILELINNSTLLNDNGVLFLESSSDKIDSHQLSNLSLKKERRFSKTLLQEFRK